MPVRRRGGFIASGSSDGWSARIPIGTSAYTDITHAGGAGRVSQRHSYPALPRTPDCQTNGRPGADAATVDVPRPPTLPASPSTGTRRLPRPSPSKPIVLRSRARRSRSLAKRRRSSALLSSSVLVIARTGVGLAMCRSSVPVGKRYPVGATAWRAFPPTAGPSAPAWPEPLRSRS
jgi:hypothetical protein